MDSGWELPCTIVLTLAAAYGVPKLLRFMFRKIDVRDLLFGDRQQRDEKPGVVYLHMFPRSVARQVVNLSPFAVKLETWLRLRKLPYEVGTKRSNLLKKCLEIGWFLVVYLCICVRPYMFAKLTFEISTVHWHSFRLTNGCSCESVEVFEIETQTLILRINAECFNHCIYTYI